MFVLKSLLGKMWGNPANPELIQIPAGQLYLVRPNSIKGSRECIFPDAVATIRRTGIDYQYQLVVTRAYDEGEEQLLDDDAETDDERVFLLDEALGFRFGDLDGAPSVGWNDLNGDAGDMWEFVSSKTVPKPTNSLFELTVLNCVYERKFHRSHEEASEHDLRQLRMSQHEPVERVASGGELETAPEETFPVDMAALNVTHGTTDPPTDPFADIPVLSRAPAELYVFDTETDMFVLQEKAVQVDIADNGEYDTWIIVRNSNMPFISVPINSELNPRFDMPNYAFMFTFRPSDDLPGLTWCLRFPQVSFPEWKDRFTIHLWEGKNRCSYAKAKKDEQRYIQEALEDVEMIDPDEDGETGHQSDSEDEDPSEAESEGDSRDETEDTLSDLDPKTKNQQLAVGYKNDLSYVTRGSQIGVFAHTNDRFAHRATIESIKDIEGRSFTPKQVMLHNQDSDMLLLNPANRNSVFRMDLEYGKIVDEWKISDHIQVDNILPEAKYAQMNPQQTIIGHSHNGLFRIDPRVSGNKLVDSQYKQYSTKNDFSAAATTESGKLAVASNKGDIRLFDAIGKNAKTALPALGDPIIGLDVSADGRWLVATCKTYLLLIDTLIGSGRYQGSLGFERSFPSDSKPVPRRLQLRPEHVAYMGGSVAFTPARFNTGMSETEKAIVTSTGRYVITWNFRRLKQGRTDDYQIKQYDANVVADNFKFGADKNIIVALEHDVLLANKKDLAKPTRSSLAGLPIPHSTPSRKLRDSRSQIVNSPY